MIFLICFAHSIAYSQWKNSYFPLRPEPLVGYKLSRVALGTRMSSAFLGKKGEVMLVMTKYTKNYGSTICQSLANELFHEKDLCILN